MIASFDSFHYLFVDVDLQVMPNLVEKHSVHELVVGSVIVLKTKGHDIGVVVVRI